MGQFLLIRDRLEALPHKASLSDEEKKSIYIIKYVIKKYCVIMRGGGK